MPRLVSHPDEVKVLSRRFGLGATNIDKYVELDGYAAVQKAIAQGEEMSAWIINTMKSSGLRGRGGAGFPTGMKWSFVPKTSAKPKYVLVNGDESEPGTCKDHVIFREDPHAVIEGTMIAGLAVGAKMGFIYLRGEYRYLLNIMEKAVADAYAKGFLGKNIFGNEGLDFDIVTQTGAGAYEVGEESALMESLEGKRGIPRIRPPFPAVVGLYGGPTIINNAETIANAPHILLMGGEEFAKLGSERNGGTRLRTKHGVITQHRPHIQVEQVQPLRNLLDHRLRDIPHLILRIQQHRNQRRPLHRVDRHQLVEACRKLRREDRIGNRAHCISSRVIRSAAKSISSILPSSATVPSSFNPNAALLPSPDSISSCVKRTHLLPARTTISSSPNSITAN